MRTLFVIVALLALAAATACGGSDEPTAQRSAPTEAGSPMHERDGEIKACGLLTAADVEAFFGAPTEPNSEQNHATQCGYWAPETGPAGVTLRLSAGSEFRSSWASNQMRSMSDVEDIAGLGEAAVWVSDMGALVVLSEDQTYVLIGAGALDTKRHLMQRILDRS